MENAEGDNDEPVHVCSGCGVAVHESCYGVVPQNKCSWKCAVCLYTNKDPKQCILCTEQGPVLVLSTRGRGYEVSSLPKFYTDRSTGGAMKRDEDGNWAHISCVDAIPELFYGDVINKDKVSSTVRCFHKQAFSLMKSISIVRATFAVSDVNLCKMEYCAERGQPSSLEDDLSIL